MSLSARTFAKLGTVRLVLSVICVLASPLFIQLRLFSQNVAQFRYYYAIENLDTSSVVRRGTTIFGGTERNEVILAPNTKYRQWLLEADTGRIGFTDFTTPSS